MGAYNLLRRWAVDPRTTRRTPIARGLAVERHAPRAQCLGEFFGHIGMLDRLLERRKHLTGELARAIHSPAARSLAELLAHVVVQVKPPCVIAAGLDPHGRRILHIGSAKVLFSGERPGS